MPQKEAVPVIGFADIEIEKEDEEIGLKVGAQSLFSNGETIQVWLNEDECVQLEEALARVRQAPEAVTVETSPVTPTPVSSNGVARAQVEAFIAAETPMFIAYTEADGTEVRRYVSPYEIRPIQHLGFPGSRPEYVTGWDHTAEGFRNFRISGITGIAPAPVEYRQPE